MRANVTIDDELYQKAISYLDPSLNKTEVFREAMKAFVRVEAGKRLAAMGGTMPDAVLVPRRRPEGGED